MNHIYNTNVKFEMELDENQTINLKISKEQLLCIYIFHKKSTRGVLLSNIITDHSSLGRATPEIFAARYFLTLESRFFLRTYPRATP